MKIILFILFTLLLGACSKNKTNNTISEAAVNCHIEGVVHNRAESTKLLLYTGIDGNVSLSAQPYEVINIRNGKFACDISLDEAQYCELIFEEERKGGSWQQIEFVADNGTIKMELYPRAEFSKTQINGDGHTAEYQSFQLRLRELQTATNEIRATLKNEGRYYSAEHNALMAQIEALEENSPERNKLIEQLQKMTDEQIYSPEAYAEREGYKSKRKAAQLEIVSGEPSVAKLTMLARQMVYSLPDQEFIDAFHNIFLPAMPDHSLTKFCQRQIAGFGLKVGAKYIDFEAPDLNGQMHRLSDMVEGAELVVLDLWASWCAPCRRAAIEIIPLYDEYKDKGFMVIGVARESGNTKALEKAIKKDGYKWAQLVELDDRANLWAKYGCINTAGRRIVFDAEGKIVAFDPTIEQLTAEVERRFKKN